MDADVPRCPTCGTPVLPHWDWCNACGYDPDGLKPAGWVSPHQAAAEAETKGGRRGKRAGHRKNGKQAPQAAVPVTSAVSAAAKPSISDLVDPVIAPAHRALDDPVDLVPNGTNGAASPVATPQHQVVASPAPAPAPVAAAGTSAPPHRISEFFEPVVPGAPMGPATPATPAKRSRKDRKREKAATASTLAAPSPVAPSQPTVAPIASPSGERIFKVGAGQFEKAGAFVLAAVAAGLAYLAVISILSIVDDVSSSTLNNFVTVVFILLCAMAAAACVAQAAALMRQRIELSATEVVAFNRFGRVKRAPRDEIHTIRMGTRQYNTVRGLNQPMDVPYLQCTDGSGFYLDALGAKSPLTPPSDEQLGLFDQLGRELETTGTRRV